MDAKKNIEWIDIAKGIGIFTVIACHTIYLSYSYPLIAFNMPLFFFLSGLLLKDKKVCFADYLKSKTKSLIRPWFIMLFISFLVCLLIPQWRNEITIEAVLSDLYTANTNVFQNSSLWYLVCFYFMLLIFFFVNKIKRTILFAIIFIAFAIGTLWMKELLALSNLPFHRLPLKIDSAMIALVFFSVAYLYKDKFLSVMSNKISLSIIIPIVVVSAMLCVYNRWSNINSLDFGKIRILFYPTAFMGTISVCLISQFLSRQKWVLLRQFFIFYGKNSLLIFGFQSLFIRLYLYTFNQIGGLNMQLYGFNPWTHQIGAFLTVSLILSPLIVYVFQSLRKHDIRIL